MHAKEPMLTSVIPEYPFQIVDTDFLEWSRIYHSSRLLQQILGDREVEKKRQFGNYSKIESSFSRYGIPKVVRGDKGP